MGNPSPRSAGQMLVAATVGAFLFKKKKPDQPAAAPAPAPGAPGQGQTPQAPAAPKTQQEKMAEWSAFEQVYGRPHPEAPGWVSSLGASHAAKVPKCPADGATPSFEPYSGGYFCPRCRERYTAEQVFKERTEEDQYTEAAAAIPSEDRVRAPAVQAEEQEATPKPLWMTLRGVSADQALSEAENGQEKEEAPPPQAGSPPASSEGETSAPTFSLPPPKEEPTPPPVPTFSFPPPKEEPTPPPVPAFALPPPDAGPPSPPPAAVRPPEAGPASEERPVLARSPRPPPES